MRKDMMEILVCPVCKGTLTLTIDKENSVEIVDGSLHCAACNETRRRQQARETGRAGRKSGQDAMGSGRRPAFSWLRNKAGGSNQ